MHEQIESRKTSTQFLCRVNHIKRLIADFAEKCGQFGNSPRKETHTGKSG